MVFLRASYWSNGSKVKYRLPSPGMNEQLLIKTGPRSKFVQKNYRIQFQIRREIRSLQIPSLTTCCIISEPFLPVNNRISLLFWLVDVRLQTLKIFSQLLIGRDCMFSNKIVSSFLEISTGYTVLLRHHWSSLWRTGCIMTVSVQ